MYRAKQIRVTRIPLEVKVTTRMFRFTEGIFCRYLYSQFVIMNFPYVLIDGNNSSEKL